MDCTLDIFFLEAILNGLLLAGLLALLALGLNLIFGVIDVVWICYAELVMVGMYGIHYAYKGGTPFLLAALAVISSWSIGGLFFSLGPQLAAHLFNSSNAIVSGNGIVALAGAAVVAQLLTSRSAPWIGAGVGSIALAAGMVLIVFAAARGSSAAYLAGSILGGAGFGAAFLGGLRTLAAAIPQQHRAAVMSAFYVAAYASLSLPAVLAGIVVTQVALPTTFEIFGSVVAAIALTVAVEAWRTLPTRQLAA